MSAFAVWAQSPAGTLALTGCALVVGMILGYLTGHKAGHRHAEDDAAERRDIAKAEQWYQELRRQEAMVPDRAWRAAIDRGLTNAQPLPEWEDREELLHEWHDHPPLKWDDEGVPGCPSCERRWEPARVASALAFTTDPGGDPSVTAWTQAMAAGMDAWLAEHVYGVPYSADELWSGQ